MSTALAGQQPEDSTDETIRRTVRALRSAAEADAGDLARHLGISRASPYNRLNGVAPFLAAEIAGLASFFGCSIQDIYDGVVRVRQQSKGTVTDTRTPRYLGPSVPSRPALTLVTGSGPRNLGVTVGNGSSPGHAHRHCAVVVNDADAA